MSARTNLILKDRAGTPVSHTYTPDGDDPKGVHIWSEKTSVPAGNPAFTASLRQTGGKYRITLKLKVPIVQTQTINGVASPIVVRTSVVDASFAFDPLSSDQERKDVVGLFAESLLASQTQINDMLVNLSDVY